MPNPTESGTLGSVSLQRVMLALAVVALALVLIAVGAVFYGPTSGEIRLDSGDLRYRYWGIPIEYHRMPEPQRTRLIALAGKSGKFQREWVVCQTYPLRGSNHADWMCQSFYFKAEAWIDADPNVALRVMEDLAQYTGNVESAGGLPRCYHMLTLVEGTGLTRPTVPIGWRVSDEALDYLGPAVKSP